MVILGEGDEQFYGNLALPCFVFGVCFLQNMESARQLRLGNVVIHS